jgi:hypothetical protein
LSCNFFQEQAVAAIILRYIKTWIAGINVIMNMFELIDLILWVFRTLLMLIITSLNKKNVLFTVDLIHLNIFIGPSTATSKHLQILIGHFTVACSLLRIRISIRTTNWYFVFFLRVLRMLFIFFWTNFYSFWLHELFNSTLFIDWNVLTCSR